MATRADIGQVEVIALLDCAPPPFDPRDFFPDVPLEGWAPHRKYALDSDGKFRTNFGAFLLRGPGFTVLVDTGAGPGPIEAIGGAEGRLLARIGEAGVRRDDVTAVVLTHLHFDHIGWTVTSGPDGEPAPTFPNAKYLISQGEWDYWTSAPVLKEHPEIESNILPLDRAGKVIRNRGEQAVAEGIRTVPTPGHTPGHQSVLVESDGARGLIAGDIVHSSAQFTELEWCSGFDMDYETARASRRRMVEKAAAEKMLVAASHLLIDSNIGHVVELEGRYYWQGL